jgi:hypothetical protein
MEYAETVTEVNKILARPLTLFQWYAMDEDITLKESKAYFAIISEFIFANPNHSKDCTKKDMPCNICKMEIILNEYYTYFENFNKEK